MAAQLRNIIVNVLDDSNNALANAAVTLLGGGSPQVLQTGVNGQCTFSTMPPGNYKLMIAHEGFNTRATSFTHGDAADSDVKIAMRVVDEDSAAAKKSLIFQILTVLQYVLLGVLALGFAWVLSKGFTDKNLDLGNKEAARGMITYVVSVVTVAIGLILVMSAAFLSGSKDLDKRFAFGKDVFTILVGVLGTIMGFYYGQAAAGAGATAAATGQTAQTIQITAPQLTPTKINTPFTMTATISGGEKPYTYTVTFGNPAAITDNPAEPQKSADGNINHRFTIANVPSLAGVPITYKIEVKDSKGVTGLFDKGTFTPTQ